MNWPHLHLMLNHIPFLGTFFGLALLVLALVRRSEELTRVALATFVLVAVTAVPTYIAGERAEEVVEHLAGSSESVIEEHEESALLSLIAAEGLGVISLVGLLLFRGSRGIPRPFAGVCLAGALLAGSLLARTAHLGRPIRHPEVQNQAFPSAMARTEVSLGKS